MATSSGGDSSSDDSEFSETVLKYISQILMEDNIEDKPCMFFDPLSLQVTEKSFYDVLGQKSPPSPNQDRPPLYVNHKAESPEDVFPGSNFGTKNSSSSTSTDPQRLGDGMELLTRNFFTSSEFLLQFRRGLEEGGKFLPRDKGDRENSTEGSRGRKNHEREDTDLEGRSNKQSAVYMEESDLSEMFDKVLLSTDTLPLLCFNNETLQNEASQPNGGKSRAEKQGKKKKKDSVDLGSLLILCAQAVAAADIRTANELLKQIRQHSSPSGDGSQRLAHYFANALEARLAGSGAGTQIFYTSFLSKRISASEILNAYKVHVSTCPFKRISLFFTDKMIYKVAEKSTSLHIIDFGIQYGFQWPILIQKLSKRAGGPPKLRITGIQLPQPGFRPTERIDETGRRLAKYCERFDVPFEYLAITSHKWETIRIEDLKIDRSETLAVNCAFRFRNLLDESVEEESPRDAVLNLLRRMNPDIFVHSIVNGSYNVPFFVSRFREALFYFSALFDIFDVTLPRENQERLFFEREFYGMEVMNVVACEGLERVERPETYKQWQVRIMRAGFRQLPLDQELMNKLRSELKEWYHKDFEVEEDNHWLLQGWKGRIIDASCCWISA